MAHERAWDCRFETVPDRLRRNSGLPGPRRLLELLDRPMRGSETAEQLGVSYQSPPTCGQAARTRTGELRGSGHAFLDLKVMRADKKTPLLSRDEERLLSATPRGYATNARKIRLAARMPENKVAAHPRAFDHKQICRGTRWIQGRPPLSDYCRRFETPTTQASIPSGTGATPTC
jgi:hypothetical protein